MEPSNSNKNTKITYESSNEQIATVDENGKVSIKGTGTVVITATSKNGKKAYSAIEIIEPSELGDKEIGDINLDKKVDTTDLLSILRHIAGTSSSKISEKHQEWNLEGDKYILADINGNGIVDVTDSLKLQRHIAASRSQTIRQNHPDWLLGEILNQKTIEQVVYEVGYTEMEESQKKVILSNDSEFEEYFSKIPNSETIRNQYNEQFFEEKSLAVVYQPLSNSNQTLVYEGNEKQGDAITIQYKINQTEEIGATVMRGSIIIIETDKNITKIIE